MLHCRQPMSVNWLFFRTTTPALLSVLPVIPFLSLVVSPMLVLAQDEQLEFDDLPDEIRGSTDLVPVSRPAFPVGMTMQDGEKLLIEQTLQQTGGNREKAAKILNIGARTLYRKLKEYGLS